MPRNRQHRASKSVGRASPRLGWYSGGSAPRACRRILSSVRPNTTTRPTFACGLLRPGTLGMYWIGSASVAEQVDRRAKGGKDQGGGDHPERVHRHVIAVEEPDDREALDDDQDPADREQPLEP